MRRGKNKNGVWHACQQHVCPALFKGAANGVQSAKTKTNKIYMETGEEQKVGKQQKVSTTPHHHHHHTITTTRRMRTDTIPPTTQRIQNQQRHETIHNMSSIFQVGEGGINPLKPEEASLGRY